MVAFLSSPHGSGNTPVFAMMNLRESGAELEVRSLLRALVRLQAPWIAQKHHGWKASAVDVPGACPLLQSATGTAPHRNRMLWA